MVFNIQRYCVHDGPGIRTTVFLKGCPLHCLWCHNPESQGYDAELVLYEKRCIGCGVCAESCKNGAIQIREGRMDFDRTQCRQCGDCAQSCYAGARSMAGQSVGVDWVMGEVEKDRVFYESSGGGVTFSGGEPLSQPEFLGGLLKQCKKAGLHTTVDTSGFAANDVIWRIAPFTDLFLYDLKMMDDEKHILYTGVSNRRIMENLELINDLGNRIFIRIPIVPGVNDSEEEMSAAAVYIKKLKGVEQVNLLPYHRIAEEKYRRLEKGYLLQDVKEPTYEEMEGLAGIFEKAGLTARIGG